MSTVFLERTFCYKVKTILPILNSNMSFLERTFCYKVKTPRVEWHSRI